VNLKAGQNLLVQVTLAGNPTRRVAVALKDPAGDQVALSAVLEVKQTELKVEANATGKYDIVVISDQIGAFKLHLVPEAGEEGDDEPDIKALEDKIQQLQQELSEAQAKLKALKKKPTAKRR
jgi:hypothetical protein